MRPMVQMVRLYLLYQQALARWREHCLRYGGAREPQKLSRAMRRQVARLLGRRCARAIPREL